MNTLDRSDIRKMLSELKYLEDLANIITRNFPGIASTTTAQRGAIEAIRTMLLNAALTDVAVEPVSEARAA